MTLQSPVGNARHGEALIELLTRQRDLYVHLKSLSERQAQLIAEEQTDQLLSLLAQRQRLVDGLTKLNRDLVAHRREVPDLQSSLATAERTQVRALMDEVETLLQEIIAQDDRDRQQLQAAQQQVGTQLKQVRQVSAAAQAYGAPAARIAPRLTDRQV